MDNSAACLFKAGELVAAVEEERLSRIKNDGAFPHLAIAECLRIGGVTLAQIDRIAVYWQPWRIGTRAFGVLSGMARAPGSIAATAGRIGAHFRALPPQEQRAQGAWSDLFRLRRILRDRFGPFEARISYHDHHLCHQLYAEAMQDWDTFASLSYDGGGETASTVLSVVRDGRRQRISLHRWPNSLGHFYSVFTGFLGFRMLEGEYKMMGLAPYGRPVFAETLRRHILRLEGDGRYRLNTALCDYHAALAGRFHPRLEALFGPRRAPDADPTEAHVDLAASVQAVFEAAQAHVLAPLRHSHPDLRHLVISGGCALNVTANGRLLQEGPFERIVIPPAPHDAGCAIGAVLALRQDSGQSGAHASIRSPYQGAGFGAQEIAGTVAAHCVGTPAPLSDADLCQRTAAYLAAGQVVAWFQGRAEFGPRALGARSFLADPRRDAIREDLNAKIKKRELFRPFAPSVTIEAASDYFHLDQPSPYMNIVARVRDNKAAAIPAVTHVDQTARVHSVSREANPLYHALLSEFGRQTGVPVLLNTSFNIQEPIVYSPAQAMATFRASGADVLALGPYLIRREDLA